MNCLICRSPAQHAFHARVLDTHDVEYFQCAHCRFLFTETPHWLPQAYSPGNTAVDTALAARPLGMREPVCKLIRKHLDPGGRFLDFGGGSGLFTRLMRDRGYDFFHHDRFSANVFAAAFDLSVVPPDDRNFELITAFEVMEHLPDPLLTTREILSWTDNFFFTTELIPATGASPEWSYLGFGHGQHVSFYHEGSLRALARELGVHYIPCGPGWHLLSRSPRKVHIESTPLRKSRVARKLGRVLAWAFSTEQHWLTRNRGGPEA